jgi:iron complex transport system substrate-binding protein
MFKLLILLSILSFSELVSAAGITGICAKKLKQRKFLKVHNKYATGFSIKRYKGFYLLTIEKPWLSSKKSQEIFLVENPLNFPSTCQKYFNIKIPVKSVASFSTTHIPALEILDEIKSIKAFSNLNFVYNKTLKEAEKKGEVFELGSPPSGERLVALKSDVVFSYSTSEPRVEGISQLIDLKIPLVFISEFREKHPLARAEWIKVFGLFYGKLDFSHKKFKEIESRYLEVSEIALKARPKRKVLVGELIKGIWKAPGGKSDLATLISDAGGEYVWSEEKSNSTLNLNIEKVLFDSKIAEVWLPQNMAVDLKKLFNDENYKSISNLKDLDVYNIVNRLGKDGGNDYWESALMRPDLLIQDLLKIFHPILIPRHDLIWYKNLE